MKYEHHIALPQVRTQSAQKEAPLGLLKLLMETLPGSVYLVRGDDTRLVLANRTAARVWGAFWLAGQPLSEFLSSCFGGRFSLLSRRAIQAYYRVNRERIQVIGNAVEPIFRLEGHRDQAR